MLEYVSPEDARSLWQCTGARRLALTELRWLCATGDCGALAAAPRTAAHAPDDAV